MVATEPMSAANIANIVDTAAEDTVASTAAVDADIAAADIADTVDSAEAACISASRPDVFADVEVHL